MRERKGETEEQNSHPLACCGNGCRGQDCDRLRPEASSRYLVCVQECVPSSIAFPGALGNRIRNVAARTQTSDHRGC